jgi:hypothetical protein
MSRYRSDYFRAHGTSVDRVVAALLLEPDPPPLSERVARRSATIDPAEVLASVGDAKAPAWCDMSDEEMRGALDVIAAHVSRKRPAFYDDVEAFWAVVGYLLGRGASRDAIRAAVRVVVDLPIRECDADPLDLDLARYAMIDLHRRETGCRCREVDCG